MTRSTLIRIQDPNESIHDTFVIPPEGMKDAVIVVDHVIRAIKAAKPEGHQGFELAAMLKPLGFVFPEIIVATEDF